MKPPRTLKVTSSLARQLARPGGRTVADAERLAERGLESHRESALADLGRIVGRLETVCAEAPAEGPSRVYDLAASLVDVAGFLDTGPFYEAAYSLCELSDRMRLAGAWSWPAAEVHVKALRLIHAGGCRRDEATEVLLEGLRRVLTMSCSPARVAN